MTPAAPALFVDDGGCFACGRRNDLGLKMNFASEAGGVVCNVRLPGWLQGWRGVAHGGVVSMLLDEAMAHALGHTGELGVTAAMSVRFRKPVPLNAPLCVRACILDRRLKFASAEAQLYDGAGIELASAAARFMIVAALPPGVRLGDESSEHG